MFTREILNRLRRWADSKTRKSLIIRGARQVGKTSAVKLFGEEFDQNIYLNLEDGEERKIFELDLPVKDIFQAILLKKSQVRQKGRILLFIDEIQNCPKAVALLRYFYECLPEIYTIAAGSFLEVRLGRKQISFPVGRVEFQYLYPLSFREYLVAMGETEPLTLLDTIPFPTYGTVALLKHFHNYALIGGMPEVVARYGETRDITALADVYHTLLVTYMEDVEKYAPDSKKILRHCIETIPYEAGKRIKFEGFGHSRFRSREISESLKTLEQAMLIHLLYPTTSLEPPAVRNMKKAPRLQFLDTGLLNFAVGLQSYFFEFENLHAFYKGLIAEHLVGQELLSYSSHFNKPLFWVREKKQSTAEVDYLIPYSGLLIPVEVKAGKTGRLRSLHQFIDRCPHHFAVRLHSGDLMISNETTPSGKKYVLLSLPYYLVCKLNEYLGWVRGAYSKEGR